MIDFITILFALITLVVIIYLYIQYKYSYWIASEIPTIPPKFPLGNIQGIGNVIHTSLLMQKFYRQMKGKGYPVGGIFFFVSPVALVLDIALVKNVLVKDFNYFQNRGVYYNERDDPLSAHLFSIEGDKWRNLRSKLTPTFTSGKMKTMFPVVLEVCHRFVDILQENIKTSGPMVEMKDMLARFTTDVIGTCAFGIECNSLKDPNTEFRQKGRKVFEVPKRYQALARFLMATCSDLSRFFGLRAIDKDISDFFFNVIRDTINFRKENNIQRDDFMNLLIQLKNKRNLDDSLNKGNGVDGLSFNEIAAQAFVFFLAGFETSSTTMSFTLYELALNPDIQKRAREEVQQIMSRHNNNLNYEAVHEMVYLEKIINESLRKYPPGANLLRTISNDYKIEDTNIILQKGKLLLIPVYAIHHDSEYYPNPEKFDPERFTHEEIQKRPSYTFLPFGEGPRNCIGLRFALMETKIGLANLLLNFKFFPSDKTEIPLRFSTKSPVLTADGGLFLNIEKI